MSMLKTQQQQGTIVGIRITDEDSLLHQLFADDTGLFLQIDRQVFQNTKEVLNTFQLASGAKLNLAKTVVLPLRQTMILTWLQQSECTIATPSDTFRYMGILAGTNVLEDEILSQLKERDKTWKIKRPLIAWKVFARKRRQGGLGWQVMEDLANAFLLRSAKKILQNADDDWVRIARAIVTYTIRNSNRPKEIRYWEPHLPLLALQSLRIPTSNTLDRMLKAWFRIKKKLRWNPMKLLSCWTPRRDSRLRCSTILEPGSTGRSGLDQALQDCANLHLHTTQYSTRKQDCPGVLP
ncbi:hypothetical protein R1sor_001869 [Riccia sorocarpa]|uniref:Reverse transcriptase domain-containing protein n=1 Tax=Riccia sorocarpa TaxID=122646 RepID=A0ABD3GZP1_9MARC